MEKWLACRVDLIALLMLMMGFLMRLSTARIAFLNPDEVYHALLGNPSGFWAACESAVRSPHPPLFIMLLHYVQLVSRSEIALRMAPVLAGSLVPWIAYRWVGRGCGKTAGLIALAILAFTPNLVNLSAEARAYGLLLLFMACALYFLDSAIEKSSPWRMAMFALALCLAILTEYSAAWFALALGVYFLLRIREPAVTNGVRIVWELGQMVAVTLYMFLYVTQLQPLMERIGPRTDIATWLREAYPQAGQNPLGFAVLGTAKQFAYMFPALIPAVAAMLLFLAAVVLLWRSRSAENPGWSRPKAVLLVLPFLISCAGAFTYLHPYGRSRHTIFLSLFIAAGVAIGLDKLLRSRVAPVALGAILLVPGWQMLNAGRYDSTLGQSFRRSHMVEAVEFLRASAPPGSLILTESETRVVLAYYLGATEWLPESRGLPSEERIGGYRVFAAHWAFQNPDDVRADLELMRQTCGLDPAEPVWVVDGGFTVGVSSLFDESGRSEDRPQPHWFGERLVMFQMPPASATEGEGAGERIPGPAKRSGSQPL